MAKVKDCPGFETFGADVKEARKAKNLARKDLAEKVNIDTRYLANIENEGTIPSLPVIIQLVKICGLPGRGSGAGSEPLAKAGMENEQRQSRIASNPAAKR